MPTRSLFFSKAMILVGLVELLGNDEDPLASASTLRRTCR